MLSRGAFCIGRTGPPVTVFAAIIFIPHESAWAASPVDIMRYETAAYAASVHTRPCRSGRGLSDTDARSAVGRGKLFRDRRGWADYRLRVDVEEGVNFRRVEATAEMEIPDPLHVAFRDNGF